MSQDLDRTICERYPSIFAERNQPGSSFAMSRGIECRDGWYTLIDTLFAGLQQKTDNGNAGQVVAMQVKEKFGGLRFYAASASEGQRAMIELVESLSRRTCEVCGAPGEQLSDGWIRTRCNSHQETDLVKNPAPQT